MNKLKDRLLSSIEVHGKVDIAGLLQLYPNDKKFTIIRNLFVLQSEGWIFVRKFRTIDGVKTRNPNVRRTKKHTIFSRNYSNYHLALPCLIST